MSLPPVPPRTKEKITSGSFLQHECVLALIQCVYWSWFTTVQVCVSQYCVCAAVFTVRVCAGHGLPQHVCASSFAVRGCTGHGFPSACGDIAYCSTTVQLAMIPAFPQLPSVTQNMPVMRHVVT